MGEHYSLRDLNLAAGEAMSDDVQIDLEPYRQAGIDYTFSPTPVPARLDVSAMLSGIALRLRLIAETSGPCARCLKDTAITVRVDSHEVDDRASDDPELHSDFVEAEELDVQRWAQEAVALEFPARVLCSADCKGLCAICGADLNETDCGCEPDLSDSRWDKLRDVKFE